MKNLNDLQKQIIASILGSEEFNETIKQRSASAGVDSGLYLSWVYSQQVAARGFAKKSFDLCQNIAKKADRPAALGEKWLLRTECRQKPLYGTNKIEI